MSSPDQFEAPLPVQADLVYDVGLHRGEDTAFYLAKGFRVVGIEADPELAAAARERFSEEISAGRLAVVEGAIAEPSTADDDHVTFYKNELLSVWGTVQAGRAALNEHLGAPSRAVRVRRLDFAGVLREHGMPYYLKVDIEGADLVCIRALLGLQSAPHYLSLESDKTSYAAIREEVDLLVSLGYDAFQAVEQSSIPDRQRPPEPPREGAFVAHTFAAGSSGLFGRELEGAWEPRGRVLRRYRRIALGYAVLGDSGLLVPLRFRGGARLRWIARRLLRRLTKAPVPGWYDTHARHRSARDRVG